MDSIGKHFAQKRPYGCRRLFGCTTLLLIGLFLLLGLCLLALFARPAAAQQPNDSPLAVWLLIDNSNSMFDRDGVGSDPNLLRLDAARLFLSYLGVDDSDAQHQAGVIFFGSVAETAVPLTPLTHETQRAALFAQLANPPRQGWTDPLSALDLAQTERNTLSTEYHTAVILLTDGKPEWSNTPTPEQLAAYRTALLTRSEVMADSNTALFIILLANTATDSDPEIATVWEPLWQQMSAATPAGGYFVARQATDLPGIYHDIVALLTGNSSEGVVYQTAVPPTGTETTLTIPPGLSQLTLVISKADPAQTVELITADGQPLTEADPTVRQAGSDQTPEEVWVIEQPTAGDWVLRIEGAGAITVWQDGKPAATQPKQPSATPQPQPAVTAAPTQERVAVAASPAPTPTAPAAATAIATVVAQPAAISSSPPPETNSWGWLWALGAGGALLAGVSTLLLVHQAGQRPRLSGTLRLLNGARTADGQTVIELEPLRADTVRLGQPPAEIPLPNATAQLTLSLGRALGDTNEILVRSSGGDPRLDGMPLMQERRLLDTAVLDLGGIQLRYENLRLRQAEREQAHHLGNQHSVLH